MKKYIFILLVNGGVIIGQNQPISPELRNSLLKSGASLEQLEKAKDLIKSSQNIDLNQFEDDISCIIILPCYM